jgi:hypothetical protein
MPILSREERLSLPGPLRESESAHRYLAVEPPAVIRLRATTARQVDRRYSMTWA